MNNRDKYKKMGDEGYDDQVTRFAHGKIHWTRSKEEVWAEMEAKMALDTEPEIIRIRSGWTRYAAAAFIVVLFSITSLMRFYSRSYSTLAGEQLSVNLPDGSVVTLNSGTQIKYNPYWYYISRTVSLDGEALFDVEKGEQFEVTSPYGITSVLGTTFNILAVDEKYEVTCLTGKVKVVATGTGEEVILTPDQKAVLIGMEVFDVDRETNVKESVAWNNNEFYFTGAPLENVFEKIELQYGIRIEYSLKESYYYTGYFKKDKQVENVLNLVCQPFGINFESTSDGVYRIIQNE